MLTPRQAEAHRFIFEFIRENGEAPKYDDICEELGMRKASKGAVHQLLDQLEARGYITRVKYMARSIRILKKPPLHNTIWFKTDYDQIEEWTELVPLEAA